MRINVAIQEYRNASPHPNIHPSFAWERRPFTWVNAEDIFLYSPVSQQIGDRLSRSELRRAIALELNGKRVGWVVIAPLRQILQPGSIEDRFLYTVRSATVLSPLGATILALMLGSLLAFGLARTLYELKGVALEIAPGKYGREETLPAIRVDSERMAQILDNLIQNALRYTPPEGTIWLRATQDTQQVTLQVCDNGIGIAEQDLLRIFDAFIAPIPRVRITAKAA